MSQLRWKYHLQSGFQLRDSINADDSENILIALKKCYEEIHSLMPKIYDEDELEKDIEEIENQIDNCQNFEEYDMTEKDVENAINYMLNQFYDFCDYYKIWINMNF